MVENEAGSEVSFPLTLTPPIFLKLITLVDEKDIVKLTLAIC